MPRGGRAGGGDGGAPESSYTWPCGLMDKALVFGTKDCRLESCQGHACAFVGPAACPRHAARCHLGPRQRAGARRGGGGEPPRRRARWTPQASAWPGSCVGSTPHINWPKISGPALYTAANNSCGRKKGTSISLSPMDALSAMGTRILYGSSLKWACFLNKLTNSRRQWLPMPM